MKIPAVLLLAFLVCITQAGPGLLLTWDYNPPAEQVTSYRIWINGIPVETTGKTNASFLPWSMLPASSNGVWTIRCQAGNFKGWSAMSKPITHSNLVEILGLKIRTMDPDLTPRITLELPRSAKIIIQHAPTPDGIFSNVFLIRSLTPVPPPAALLLLSNSLPGDAGVFRVADEASE